MEFFTREILDIVQPTSLVPLETARLAWLRAATAYQRRVDAIFDDLPENVRDFRWTCLHGAVTESVTVIDDEITVELSTEGCGFAQRGPLHLVWRGVSECHGTDALANATWLFKEIDLREPGIPICRVLTDRGEFMVAFTALDLDLSSARA